MTIASTVFSALDRSSVEYDILNHPRSATSSQAAESAHITGDQIAKAVVLKDPYGYVLAVLPATFELELDVVRKELHRNLELATEDELESLFFDCDRGAVPPLGPDYGLPTVVDDVLCEQSDIYFEAGDHEGLVHVSETAFEQLVRDAEYFRFSSHR
ncbi:MAG: aminoacyl-tRNA deacylase [Gammaproteobacteria bacterium]